MWTRGQTGKALLPFGTYRTSAFPIAFMFRGASGRKESQAAAVQVMFLIFWPECKLHKDKTISCLSGTSVGACLVLGTDGHSAETVPGSLCMGWMDPADLSGGEAECTLRKQDE